MTDLYETQRAMRAMRRAAIQRGVIAILDVGTSKIACLILRFDGRERVPEGEGIGAMAGQTQFRVIGAATTRSRGVALGETVAMQETERAIRTAVQAAQKMANARVDHVIACLSGGQQRSYGLAGIVKVEGDVVQNLIYCLKRCDLELAGLASSSYASGIAALVEDEQELGAACIDIGGGTTGMSIFIKKHMIYSETVRLGGDHVTQDISKGLQVSMAVAERIKTFHGGVVATGMDDREMIEVGGETGDWEHDRRTVSRAELIGIIRPRVEEILEEVRERLDAAGFEHLPSQHIVLTGGASQMPGLDTLAPKILGQQVRVGRPLRVHGLPQAATGSAFASAVGLSLFAAHPQDEWWDFEMPADLAAPRSLKRAVKWFRENW